MSEYFYLERDMDIHIYIYIYIEVRGVKSIFDLRPKREMLCKRRVCDRSGVCTAAPAGCAKLPAATAAPAAAAAAPRRAGGRLRVFFLRIFCLVNI